MLNIDSYLQSLQKTQDVLTAEAAQAGRYLLSRRFSYWILHL